MVLQELSLSQPIKDILEAQKATRIAVFLRKKSPLYALRGDELVARACSTLGVDPVQCRARLLTEWKWHQLTIFTFDLWHDDYDWATAHHEVNLPVLLVDYGKTYSFVKLGSHDFQKEVNKFVADQHRSEGWFAHPPFFCDQTGPTPTYPNPRDVKMRGSRHIRTPPPGSTSVSEQQLEPSSSPSCETPTTSTPNQTECVTLKEA